MHEQERFDAAAALGEVRRIDRRARSSGRWHGWLWLAIGVMTPTFFISVYSDSGDFGLAVAVAFMVAGLVLWFWESRRPVLGREGARIDKPLTWIYVALMTLVSILATTVLPDGFSVWLLLAGMVPAVPCLIGAWLVFRR